MKTWSPDRGKQRTMGKVHYLGQPVVTPRKPSPLLSLLEWCGVLLLMMSAIVGVLFTLREIAGRLTALADRNHASLGEDR